MNLYLGHDVVQLVCSKCGCHLDKVNWNEYQKMRNRGFGKAVCMDCDPKADQTPSVLLCTAKEYSLIVDEQVFIFDSSKDVYSPIGPFSGGLESF